MNFYETPKLDGSVLIPTNSNSIATATSMISYYGKTSMTMALEKWKFPTKGNSNPASININKWGIFIPYISPAIRPRRAPAQSPKRRNTARVSDGITTLLPVEPSFPFEMGLGVSWSQIKGIHIHIIHPIRGNSWNYRPGKNMSLRIQLLPCTHRFYWNG